MAHAQPAATPNDADLVDLLIDEYLERIGIPLDTRLLIHEINTSENTDPYALSRLVEMLDGMPIGDLVFDIELGRLKPVIASQLTAHPGMDSFVVHERSVLARLLGSNLADAVTRYRLTA